MGPLWVIAETGPAGELARISAEIATLARGLAAEAGSEAVGIVVAAEPATAASQLAEYLPRVIAVAEPEVAEHAWAAPAASRIAGLVAGGAPSFILAGAGPDGRDVAGFLSVLLDLGLLTNATCVRWLDGGPVVDMSVFGGRLVTESRFTGERGIITVRQNAVTAERAGSAGTIEDAPTSSPTPAEGSPVVSSPAVRVVERLAAEAAAAPIEEARIIVAGGRGVGGPEGFGLVAQIAAALGGAVGATRAAVDSGWIPYAQQIGQTGKIVRPELYLALGISGAIQHKVGMQTATTIVAVNRDPDAPIVEFADLVVVGDLFEVGPAIVAELAARSG